jgi:hypothetical protein
MDFDHMLYLNLNAWCADFMVPKAELVGQLFAASSPGEIEEVFSSKAIGTVGYFVYLHLDKVQGVWTHPRSLN